MALLQQDAQQGVIGGSGGKGCKDSKRLLEVRRTWGRQQNSSVRLILEKISSTVTSISASLSSSGVLQIIFSSFYETVIPFSPFSVDLQQKN